MGWADFLSNDGDRVSKGDLVIIPILLLNRSTEIWGEYTNEFTADTGSGKGIDPSGVGLCNGTGLPDIGSGKSIDPSGVGLCNGTGLPGIGSGKGKGPSGVGLCNGTGLPDIGLGKGIDPSDTEKWCKSVNPCGGESVTVGAKSDPISCGDGGISDGPEVPELEG